MYKNGLFLRERLKIFLGMECGFIVFIKFYFIKRIVKFLFVFFEIEFYDDMLLLVKINFVNLFIFFMINGIVDIFVDFKFRCFRVLIIGLKRIVSFVLFYKCNF